MCLSCIVVNVKSHLKVLCGFSLFTLSCSSPFLSSGRWGKIEKLDPYFLYKNMHKKKDLRI